MNFKAFSTLFVIIFLLNGCISAIEYKPNLNQDYNNAIRTIKDKIQKDFHYKSWIKEVVVDNKSIKINIENKYEKREKLILFDLVGNVALSKRFKTYYVSIYGKLGHLESRENALTIIGKSLQGKIEAPQLETSYLEYEASFINEKDAKELIDSLYTMIQYNASSQGSK